MNIKDFSDSQILSRFDRSNEFTTLELLKLKPLQKVFEDIAKSFEFGDQIKFPTLNTSEKLIIYKYLKPYFQPNGAPQRTMYNDIVFLSGRENNPKSVLNLIPKEIFFSILKLKNEVPFMSYQIFTKFILKK